MFKKFSLLLTKFNNSNKKILYKFLFQNLPTIMGAFLAIVVYELQNTNIKEHQEVDNSFTRGESITPGLYTNLVYVDRTPESFNEDYTVRLRDGISILIERDIATQTPEAFRN